MDNYSVRIENLESLEQELSQNIRTSGLRKPRETFLIDKIQLYRRDRRQLTHDLISSLNSVSQENENLRQLIDQLNHKMKLLVSKEEEINDWKSKYSDLQTEVRGLLERMKAKYQTKIYSLELKLSEVQLANEDIKRQDLRAEKKQWEKEMQTQYAEKMDNYKKVLEQLSSAEQEVRNKLRSMDQAHQSQQQEYRILQDKYAATEIINTDLMNKVRMLSKSTREYDLQVNTFKSKLNDMELEKDALIRRQKEEIERIYDNYISKQEHESALQRIDTKIRNIVHAKDTSINELYESLKISEERRISIEQMLIQINDKLK